jgi:hypothetical protein
MSAAPAGAAQSAAQSRPKRTTARRPAPTQTSIPSPRPNLNTGAGAPTQGHGRGRRPRQSQLPFSRRRSQNTLRGLLPACGTLVGEEGARGLCRFYSGAECPAARKAAIRAEAFFETIPSENSKLVLHNSHAPSNRQPAQDGSERGRKAGTARVGQRKKKSARGSAQPIEKARFRQGNPRKSKLFPCKNLAGVWSGLAGFGKIWDRFGKSDLPVAGPSRAKRQAGRAVSCA